MEHLISWKVGKRHSVCVQPSSKEKFQSSEIKFNYILAINDNKYSLLILWTTRMINALYELLVFIPHKQLLLFPNME